MSTFLVIPPFTEVDGKGTSAIFGVFGGWYLVNYGVTHI